MAENYTLMVEKDFMARLRNTICCSDGMGTCDGGDFCGSDPTSWPTIVNGHTMVSLSNESTKKAIPGFGQFVDKYEKWDAEHSCRALAGQYMAIATGASIFANTQAMKERLLGGDNDSSETPTHETTQKELNSLDKSLRKECAILYDRNENGEETFNPARVKDLEKIDEFIANIPPPSDGDGFNWKDIFKGGGILSAGWFLVWLLYKIVRFGRKGAGHLKDSSFIIRGIGDGINSLASAIKYVFGTALPNLGKSLKYVASFKWAKGEKAPENVKAPEPAPKEEPKIEPTVDSSATEIKIKTVINPHPEVVLAQLCALVGSEHHALEGKRFAQLTDAGKHYLADLAIKRWNSEPLSRQQLFAEEDDRLTEGKLPNEFLFKFARHFLKKDANMDILEASAKVWAQQQGLKSERVEMPTASEFSPRLIDIKRQLLNDPNFQKAGADARDYIAMLAKAEWDELPENLQRSFISASDAPETGALPQRFIRMFRKKSGRDLREINLKTEMLELLRNIRPSAIEYPFSILNKRFVHLIKTWEHLPYEIKKAFQMVPDQQATGSEIPPYFVEYMFKIISIGHLARIPSVPAEKGWRIGESPDVSYQSHSLSTVMENIAVLNEKLRMHPTVLRARAQSVIDGWLLLEKGVRVAFIDNDVTQEMRRDVLLREDLALVPKNFTAFIHKFSAGISTSQRRPIKKGGGGEGGGGIIKVPHASEENSGGEEVDFNDAAAAMVAAKTMMARSEGIIHPQKTGDVHRTRYIAAMTSMRAPQVKYTGHIAGATVLLMPSWKPQAMPMMPQLQPAMARMR